MPIPDTPYFIPDFEKNKPNIDRLFSKGEEINEAMKNAPIVNVEDVTADKHDGADAYFVQGKLKIEDLPDQDEEFRKNKVEFTSLEEMYLIVSLN